MTNNNFATKFRESNLFSSPEQAYSVYTDSESSSICFETPLNRLGSKGEAKLSWTAFQSSDKEAIVQTVLSGCLPNKQMLFKLTTWIMMLSGTISRANKLFKTTRFNSKLWDYSLWINLISPSSVTLEYSMNIIHQPRARRSGSISWTASNDQAKGFAFIDKLFKVLNTHGFRSIPNPEHSSQV